MSKEVNNLKIAKWLGWTFRPSFNSLGTFSQASSYWHHPDCVDFNGHKECGRSSLDFYTDEAANATVLERMAKADTVQLWFENGTWSMWLNSWNIADEKTDADRKTAIVMAALHLIERGEQC